ncbi:SatD family protein [Agreia bicolorata]|uniref:SatD family (SatD) n=1 Tax=Agreia bicolorata TaxID=110935 RepID=A0ABR5CBP3_9MICO|nr:SatD family protein [Agreia bicolorata]KJC63046.1 hypothetical protein TZ00_16810 [Agreia bicolorata]
MSDLFSPVAVIIDISRSRTHPDRELLQRELNGVFAKVNELQPGVQRIEPTVGDEFQAVYGHLGHAFRATLLARLFLPEQIDCRFGLGSGEIKIVGHSVVGAVQDGSAWWSAREAINEARKREYSKLGFVRTWFRVAEGLGGAALESSDRAIGEAAVNAYLLTRDHIINTMSTRTRRLFRGQLLGETQQSLAREEGITQSAVSQNLAKSGANALFASELLLLGSAQ